MEGLWFLFHKKDYRNVVQEQLEAIAFIILDELLTLECVEVMYIFYGSTYQLLNHSSSDSLG